MTKQQIINFAKAPFSRSFGIAYILTLPNLLLIPLLADFITFLIDNYKKLDNMTSNEVEEFFMQYFLPTLTVNHIVLAVIGFMLSIFLLGSYKIGLIHKTVIEQKDIFEATQIQLSPAFIAHSFLKSLGATLSCFAICILPIFLLGLLITIGVVIGEYLDISIISILVGIAGFISFFILLYKLVCYLFTANLFFLKTLKISSFFEHLKVKSYFKTNKNNIFIAFLLAYVGGQMLNVLLGSILSKIFGAVLVIGALSSIFHINYYWALTIAFLAFNILWTYLSLIHGIAYGKVILWLEHHEDV